MPAKADAAPRVPDAVALRTTFDWRGIPTRAWWPSAKRTAVVLFFLAVLGLLHVIDVPLRSGGRIGTFLGQLLVGLMGPVGAFIVLAAVGVAGLVIMLDTSLRALVAPIGRGALAVGDRLAAPSEESEDDLGVGPDGQLSAELDSRGRFTRRRPGVAPNHSSGGLAASNRGPPANQAVRCRRAWLRLA